MQRQFCTNPPALPAPLMRRREKYAPDGKKSFDKDFPVSGKGDQMVG